MNLIVKCYRENLHLLLKGTVHQSKINYSPSCCSNSIWFVSPLEQKLKRFEEFSHCCAMALCYRHAGIEVAFTLVTIYFHCMEKDKESF